MAAATLLTYVPITSPATLEAGKEGTITVTVLAPIASILCKQIVFTVNYGSGPQNIFADEPTVTLVSQGGWTSTSEIKNETLTAKTISLENNNPGNHVANPMVLTISGTVNTENQIGFINIKEDSATLPTSGSPVFSQVSGLLVFGIENPPLSITSFTAVPYTSASPKDEDITTLIPTTDFQEAAGFTLKWGGAGVSSYALYQGSTGNVYSGPNTQMSFENGINRTCTFTLEATNETGDVVSRTLTITISNPTLADLTVAGTTTVGSSQTPGTLNIYGSTTSNGAMTVDGGLAVTGTSSIADAALSGTLSVMDDTTLAETTVNGPLTASAATVLNSSLNVAEATSLASTLEVTGAATLYSTLGVTGASNLNDVTVGGDLTIKGSGGKTFLVQGVISGIYMELTDCFSSSYRYYEIILDNVIPETSGTYLRAQYYVNGAWATTSGAYSVETYSNDSGGNSANSSLNKSSLFLWPSARTGPSTSQGIYGDLKIYNPAAIGSTVGEVIYLTHTGLIYSPRAFNNYGAQIYTGGAYSYTQTSGNSVSGMRFFFSDGTVSSSVSSGTIRVYGWN